MKTVSVLMVAVALLLVTVAPEVLACPSCKETVRAQAGGNLAAGFNYTVLGLIGMVFGLFTTVASIVIRAYRNRSIV